MAYPGSSPERAGWTFPADRSHEGPQTAGPSLSDPWGYCTQSVVPTTRASALLDNTAKSPHKYGPPHTLNSK